MTIWGIKISFRVIIEILLVIGLIVFIFLWNNSRHEKQRTNELSVRTIRTFISKSGKNAVEAGIERYKFKELKLKADSGDVQLQKLLKANTDLGLKLRRTQILLGVYISTQDSFIVHVKDSLISSFLTNANGDTIYYTNQYEIEDYTDGYLSYFHIKQVGVDTSKVWYEITDTLSGFINYYKEIKKSPNFLPHFREWISFWKPWQTKITAKLQNENAKITDIRFIMIHGKPDMDK